MHMLLVVFPIIFICPTALAAKDHAFTVQNSLGDTLWYYVARYYAGRYPDPFEKYGESNDP